MPKENGRDLIAQLMGERRKEAVALLMKFSRFALSRIALLLGGQSVLQDRDVHAAIDDVDYKVAPTFDFLGAHIRSDNFLNHIGQNMAKNLELAQQRHHRKSECPPLAAMLGGVFLKAFGQLASKKFDELFSQFGEMVFEFSISNVVDQSRLLWITANLVVPPSEDLPL